MSAWADVSPGFTPGGTDEYENAAWDRRNERITHGWAEKDADAAYQADMAAEGYESEREAEIG